MIQIMARQFPNAPIVKKGNEQSGMKKMLPHKYCLEEDILSYELNTISSYHAQK